MKIFTVTEFDIYSPEVEDLPYAPWARAFTSFGNAAKAIREDIEERESVIEICGSIPKLTLHNETEERTVIRLVGFEPLIYVITEARL